MTGASEAQQTRVMERVLSELQSFPASRSPPEMAQQIQHIVRHETAVEDPYRQAKTASTEQALALVPRLRRLVSEAADPLDVALRLSIAGNIIDLGVSLDYDLEDAIQRVLGQPFAIDASASFKRALARVQSVLYLGDNAGETVFDGVLIERLKRPVTYVVKGSPILNDAIRDDALAAGLGDIATVEDNGSDAPGTILDRCSGAFQRRFAEAELIIAKGQANYETLGKINAPLFFLLQTKCAVVARELNVALHSLVFVQSSEVPAQP